MVDHRMSAEAGRYRIAMQRADLQWVRDFVPDPESPFYRFVLTYLVASAGLTPIYDDKNYPTFMQGTAGLFVGDAAGHARANLEDCVALARKGLPPLLDAQVDLCCMLANAAFESIQEKVKERTRRDPAFQYLRHVRNAVSHGNRWKFKDSEPASKAEWRNKSLDHQKRGGSNPLQGKPCFFAELKPADLLHLLQDVGELLRRDGWPI